MPRPLLIAPSILSADFGCLNEEVAAVERAGADWLHLDVMDGHFVPNITFGAPVIKHLRRGSKTFFDVHLMIAPADPFLEAFAAAGANQISVHVEAGPHLDRSLQAIRRLGVRASAAINPATPATAIAHVLDRLDSILVMTVNPGFGGQAFIPEMIEKIRQLKSLAAGRDVDIIVDGGITPDNVSAVVSAGANVLVAGSSIFTGDPKAYSQNIAALRRAAETAGGARA